jgi:integrase
MQPDKTTIAEYLTRWLDDYVKVNLSPTSYAGYKDIARAHFLPALGNIPLSKLMPEHLQRYYSEKVKAGLSAQTIRHHHTLLHKALQTAIEWQLINRNIADAVKPPRAQRPEMQVWSETEIKQFLEAAKNTPYYTIFYLLLFTGMRRSEVMALRWSDIDFILGEIHINRSLHILRGGIPYFKAPKSATGRRTVALPPSAQLVLNEYRERRESESIMLDKPMEDNDLLFCDITTGEPMRAATVSHAWSKLIKKTGMRYIRLHDARHSHASLMLKQGIHPKVVQERLGHSSITITLDIYSHVSPGLQQAAAMRFDEAFTEKYNQKEFSCNLVANRKKKVNITQ